MSELASQISIAQAELNRAVTKLMQEQEKVKRGMLPSVDGNTQAEYETAKGLLKRLLFERERASGAGFSVNPRTSDAVAE